MPSNYFIKELSKIDTADICSDWQWLLADLNKVVLVSALGDMFLQSNDGSVYWLDVGMADLTCVAESMQQFETLLTNEEHGGNWLLPGLVDQLIEVGKMLDDDKVYSFKKPPILGGDFSVDNFDTISMSVHFSFFGQLQRQIWDKKDGTPIGRIDVKD